MKKRVSKLKLILERKKLDACLIANFRASILDPTLFYFSNINYLTHAALLIHVHKEPVILTAELDYHRAKEETFISDVRKTENVIEDLSSILREFKVRKLAVNGRFLTYETLQKLKGKVEITDISKEIYNLRAVKDSEELKKLKKAVEITKKAINEVFTIVKPGLSEKEVAAKIGYAMKKLGADDLSFPTITVSGKKTANPHGVPSQKRIKRNELLLIDCGAKYENYCGDITRVIVVDGELSLKQEEVQGIVKEARKEAIKKIKPGVTNFEVDAAARKVIEEYGYKLIHGTGHGIGLEVHEEPIVSYKKYKGTEKTVLKENMTFTIEPGIYLEENFGIRIEDDVVVTKTGAVVL